MRRGRTRALLAGALAGGLTLLVSGASYAADGDAAINLVERDGGAINVLVSVPAAEEVDLDAVTMKIDGKEVDDATARLAQGAEDLRRVSMLAIDTSNSMKGERFQAAVAAANTFLNTVPDDVWVGIVTFDNNVEVPLPPTLDRSEARAVLNRLTLSRQTLLYDGVREAVRHTGIEGWRTVLVLSDGADTSNTPLEKVVEDIAESDVVVDVVSLNQAPESLGPLQQIAEAGGGEVIEATPEALEGAFARQAEALVDQILVRATVPESVKDPEATVAVTIPTSDGETLTAKAFAVVGTGGGAQAVPEIQEPVRAMVLPTWVKYVAVGALAFGLLVLLLMLVPRKEKDLEAEDVVNRYTSGGAHSGPQQGQLDGKAALASAREAAAQMLHRNTSLEGRIAARLEAAGSQLRPAEWLLIHTAIIVVSGMLGLTLGRGNLLVGLLFMGLGVLLPWMYLGFKKSRRFKAFNASLPDTLQLMAGSLQAGLSLAQSVDTIVKEGNEPIATEFKRVLIETRLGVDLEDALDGVTQRFQSKDFGWVVMAIRIQRQVGGNLAELLNTVAHTMREREYMRRQVAALSAEGKLSAWVIGALPVVFLLYLLLVRRDYVMPLFTEPLGWLMLGGAAVMLAIGAFWMSRLVKVEV